MHRALEILRTAPFAEPLPCTAAVALLRAEMGVDFARARARCGFARGHLLDVVVYVPGGNGHSRESDAAEALVRSLVGEELFERWVGSVSATPTVRGGPLTVLNSESLEGSALPIDLLLETVRAAVAGLKLGLSPLPLHSTDDEPDWVAFELDPDPEAALGSPAQDDLIVCSTRTPEAKKSFLQGEPFFSGRFSNSSALFTYLKYETSKAVPEERLAERTLFERIVRRVLLPDAGVLTGLGLGVRHSYIDLVLTDPDCARQRLLPALRAAGIPPRAWLLFFDSELEREFIPIHADGAAPHWR